MHPGDFAMRLLAFEIKKRLCIPSEARNNS